MIGDWLQNEFVKQLLLLVLVLIIVYNFMVYPLFYPLRLLNTFLHEAGHALMTVLTGGRISEFVVNPNESGHVRAHGGNRFLVSSAGYLGSSLFGAILYIAAARVSFDRWLIGILGICLGLITFYFPAQDHAIFYGIGFSAFMIMMGVFAPNWLCDITLRFIGMTCMVYTFYKVYYNIFKGLGSDTSDAHQMAETYGGSAQLWSGLWLFLIFLFFLIAMRVSLKRQKPKKTTP